MVSHEEELKKGDEYHGDGGWQPRAFRQRRTAQTVRFDAVSGSGGGNGGGGNGGGLGADDVDIHKRTFSKHDISKALSLLQMHRRRRNFVWEFGAYVTFLFLLLLIMFIGWDIESKYNLGTGMKELLVRRVFESEGREMTYNEITDAREFWDWATGPFVRALFTDTDYNGNPVSGDYLNEFNRRFGRVRFRQLRSNQETCQLWKRIDPPPGWRTECYQPYDLDSENKEPFGVNGTFTYSPASETRAFQWRSVSELILYGGGGFVVDFPTERDAFVRRLQEVKSSGYIDRGTRALFININLYNPSRRRYHSIQLLMELLTEGTYIVLDQKFRSFRIDLYETTIDYFRMACEIIFLFYVVYYVFIFGREIYSIWSRRQVFVYGSRLTFWHVVDFIALGLFLSGIGLRVFYLSYGLRRDFVDGGKLASDRYEVLEELASLDYTFDSIMAATVALSFFKSFKFLQVIDKLSLIWRVLVRSMPNMLGFLIFFAIVFIAFVVMGHIVFGPEMRDFRSFGISFSTLGRMVFGEFDYEPMSFTHPYVAPVYFYSFMILVYFILLNMFLAILNDTYQALMEEFERNQARRKKVAHVGVFTKIRLFFRRLWDKARGRTTISTIRNVDNTMRHTMFSEEQVIQRLRKSITLKTKERVSVQELQSALGTDAPPDLALGLMQSYIDSGAEVEADDDVYMNELLGFDEDDMATEREDDKETTLRSIAQLVESLQNQQAGNTATVSHSGGGPAGQLNHGSRRRRHAAKTRAGQGGAGYGRAGNYSGNGYFNNASSRHDSSDLDDSGFDEMGSEYEMAEFGAKRRSASLVPLEAADQSESSWRQRESSSSPYDSTRRRAPRSYPSLVPPEAADDDS